MNVYTSDLHDSVRAQPEQGAAVLRRELWFVKRSDFAGPEGRFLTMGFEGQDIEVVLWPGTHGAGNASSPAPGPLIIESALVVQDDRNVVIYAADGSPLWATDTAG